MNIHQRSSGINWKLGAEDADECKCKICVKKRAYPEAKFLEMDGGEKIEGANKFC